VRRTLLDRHEVFAAKERTKYTAVDLQLFGCWITVTFQRNPDVVDRDVPLKASAVLRELSCPSQIVVVMLAEVFEDPLALKVRLKRRQRRSISHYADLSRDTRAFVAGHVSEKSLDRGKPPVGKRFTAPCHPERILSRLAFLGQEREHQPIGDPAGTAINRGALAEEVARLRFGFAVEAAASESSDEGSRDPVAPVRRPFLCILRA
jgi:hypothetical protein